MIPFVYHDGGRILSGFIGHTRDCVVRSISIVSEKPYIEVYNEIKALIKVHERKGIKKRSSVRKGVYTRKAWFQEYMRKLGFDWVPTMQIGSGCKMHLHKDEVPEGKIIAVVSRHYVAIVDKVMYDTSDCSRRGTRCIYGYWKRKQG